MSNLIFNSEPSPEEVIELLQRLKTKNELRRKYFGWVSAGLVVGLVLSLSGFVTLIGRSSSFMVASIVGLFLLASGTIGVCYLALPYEVMKIARRLELSTDPNTVPPLLDALETALQVSANKQCRQAAATDAGGSAVPSFGRRFSCSQSPKLGSASAAYDLAYGIALYC